MTTSEITKRAFRMLTRIAAVIVGLIAIGLLAYFTWVTVMYMENSESSDTFWGGLFVTLHIGFMLFLMWSIWNWLTEPSND